MYINVLQRNKKAGILYLLREKLWKFIVLKYQTSMRSINICTFHRQSSAG